MKFNNRNVYSKMYGSFRCLKDRADYFAEYDVMCYYIANNYNTETLLSFLTSNSITNEYDAYTILVDQMKQWKQDEELGDFDKQQVTQGRRIFTSTCAKLHSSKEPSLQDLLFDEFPNIDKFYILYEGDSVRWVYTDESNITSEKLPVSSFPYGFKEFLNDQLVVVEREVRDYV